MFYVCPTLWRHFVGSPFFTGFKAAGCIRKNPRWNCFAHRDRKSFHQGGLNLAGIGLFSPPVVMWVDSLGRYTQFVSPSFFFHD